MGDKRVNQNLYFDEIKTLSKYVEKCKKFYEKNRYRNLYVIADSNPIAEYVVPALAAKLTETTVTVVEKFEDSSVNKIYYKELEVDVEYISWQEICEKDEMEESLFMLLLDSNTKNDVWFEILDVCVDKVRNTECSKVLVGVALPKIRSNQIDMKCLTEKGYSYYLNNVVSNLTAEEKFYLELEERYNQAIESGFERINLLRFCNLIGANKATTPNINLEELVQNIFEDSRVVIEKEDYCTEYSFIGTRDAACVLIKSAFCVKDSEIYNVVYHNSTLAKIKEIIFDNFSDKLELVIESEPIEKKEKLYCSLSNRKAAVSKCFSNDTVYEFEELIYRVAVSFSGNEYDVQKKLGCYEGKLQRLKDIEIDILKEIDRICKKHDIKWFLAGGSLLGAIRNNKSISWDDDLDIGMLREDFEKFKRIAPKELDKKYYYSSPWTDDNCHYYIDKIRLKSSYFSTAYSSHFELEDGVFVDLIVYDQTSPNRLLEKFQIKFICALVEMLRIRWYDAPKPPHFRRAKLMLPVLRHIPWKVLHKLFDIAATLFAKKKNAEYLIDSIGQHIRYGRFPKYSLVELEEREFDGMMAPTPVHYHEYLSFFYGPNYFPNPSISAQVGAHRIARLDLGEFVFEDKKPGDFREVDIRGELFEKEID